jgi:hypothetical protein
LLCRKVEALLTKNTLFETQERTAQTLDKRRRGRIETRKITLVHSLSASVNLPLYTGCAGVAQVFRLERQTIHKRTGEFWEQTVIGITSLPAKHPLGTAEALLAVLRGHWHIENRSHYVRDVTFAEDKSQVRARARYVQEPGTCRQLASSHGDLPKRRRVADATERPAKHRGGLSILCG